MGGLVALGIQQQCRRRRPSSDRSPAGCINSKRVAHARRHDRKDLLAERIARREQLYSDFIRESARAMVDAMQHTLEDPGRLTPVYALISRIRLSSPTKVAESAERLAKTILSAYSAPNLTRKSSRE
jgi:hypothetical protein